MRVTLANYYTPNEFFVKKFVLFGLIIIITSFDIVQSENLLSRAVNLVKNFGNSIHFTNNSSKPITQANNANVSQITNHTIHPTQNQNQTKPTNETIKESYHNKTQHTNSHTVDNQTHTHHRPHNHEVECKKEYVTVQGDSCFLVGTEYGLTHDEFRRINPDIICREGLKVGTKICLRASVKHDDYSDEVDNLRKIINGDRVDKGEYQQHFDVKMIRG